MKTASVRLGQVFSVIVLLSAWDSRVSAAEIAWGPAANVAGETDVSLTGTLVEAANTGADQNSVPTTTTVNGVTFAGWSVTGGGVPVSPGGRFSFTAAPGYFHQSFNGFGSGSDPFASLSAPYRALLGSGNFAQSQTNANDFTGALTLTISGLTIGTAYEFQWWANDSRPFATGPVIATTGATSIALDPNTSNAAGGVGQYAIGTFVADATTQDIVFSTAGNGTLQNGFQLRVIPEPSTIGLLLAGALLAAATARRRSAL